MKKRALKKLGIRKTTISQLSAKLVNGGGTNTCHGNSCCPTEAATCQNTCAQTCPPTCDATCGAGGGGETGETRFCPGYTELP